jgi:hypothetical protein
MIEVIAERYVVLATLVTPSCGIGKEKKYHTKFVRGLQQLMWLFVHYCFINSHTKKDI